LRESRTWTRSPKAAHCDPNKKPAALRSLLGRTSRDWWPEALSVDILHQKGVSGRSDGRRLRLSLEFLQRSTTTAEARPDRADDRQPALVAGRLRSLRPVLHPHGLARAGTYRTGDGRGGASAGSSASPRSTAGRTTATSTRRAACCGRSSRNTAASSAGPTCSSWPAMSRSNRWAARPSASAAAARTSSSPRRTSTGAPKKARPGRRPASTPSGSGKALENPLAAIQMGLIYVNPEGPGGNPDARWARRATCGNLRAHGDERRGNRRADRRRPCLRQGAWRGRSEAFGVEPEGADIASMGFGWAYRPTKAAWATHDHQGIEGAWTPTRHSGT
jgi:catalase-peroxidase